MKVYRQDWEESELGWGIRPDGYSLHLSLEDAAIFAKNYMIQQENYFKERGVKGVPDEYSRVSGKAYEVDVDKKIYQEIRKSEFGVRKWPTYS